MEIVFYREENLSFNGDLNLDCFLEYLFDKVVIIRYFKNFYPNHKFFFLDNRCICFSEVHNDNEYLWCRYNIFWRVVKHQYNIEDVILQKSLAKILGVQYADVIPDYCTYTNHYDWIETNFRERVKKNRNLRRLEKYNKIIKNHKV